MRGRCRLAGVLTLAAFGVVALLLGRTAPRPAAGQTPGATPSPTPCRFMCTAQTTTPFPFHFDGFPEYYAVGLPIALGVEASAPAGATLAYRWDWGDGTPPDTGAQATHTYTAPGSYTVRVMAIATPGGVATISTTLDVQPPPPPTVLILLPGSQQNLTTAAHCPGLFWLEGEGYTTASCGCCAPRFYALINDGDKVLIISYDLAANTLTVSAPPGSAFVATDLTGCVPSNDDNSATCPAPNSGPPSGGQALHLSSAPSGTYPATVSYPAGWNLIGGVHVSQSAGIVGYADAQGGFTALSPSQPLDQGQGYWAYFPEPVTVTLSPRGAVGAKVYVAAGQWQLIGDPGQVPVRVEGADVVDAYDPDTGSYAAVDALQPGQGAWAYSAGGGTITLTPVEP